MLDTNSETFVIHRAIQKQKEMPMHFKKQAQIKTLFGVLFFNKILTEVLAEFSNYSNIFFVKYIVELLKNIKMNQYALKQEEGK